MILYFWPKFIFFCFAWTFSFTEQWTTLLGNGNLHSTAHLMQGHVKVIYVNDLRVLPNRAHQNHVYAMTLFWMNWPIELTMTQHMAFWPFNTFAPQLPQHSFNCFIIETKKKPTKFHESRMRWKKYALLTCTVYLWLLDSIDDLSTVAIPYRSPHADSSSPFEYVSILDTLNALPTSILQFGLQMQSQSPDLKQ